MANAFALRMSACSWFSDFLALIKKAPAKSSMTSPGPNLEALTHPCDRASAASFRPEPEGRSPLTLAVMAISWSFHAPGQVRSKQGLWFVASKLNWPPILQQTNFGAVHEPNDSMKELKIMTVWRTR